MNNFRTLLRCTVIMSFALSSLISIAPKLAAEEIIEGPVQLNPYAISITPPSGWIVKQNSMGMSVVMQSAEKRPKRLKKNEVFFRPNITVSVINKPIFIDDKGAQEFIDAIKNRYTNIGIELPKIENDYKIMEYSPGKNGIIVYTTIKLNNEEVTQMHLAVSGSEQSGIVTYSNLTKKFGADELDFKKAWESVISLDIPGTPMHRYEKLVSYSAITLIGLLTGLLAMSIRNSRISRLYSGEKLHNFSKITDEEMDEDLMDTIDFDNTDNFEIEVVEEESDDIYYDEDLGFEKAK